MSWFLECIAPILYNVRHHLNTYAWKPSRDSFATRYIPVCSSSSSSFCGNGSVSISSSICNIHTNNILKYLYYIFISGR